MMYKRTMYLWFIPFIASIALFAIFSDLWSYGMGILVLFSFVGIATVVIEYMRDMADDKHMAYMEKTEELYDTKRDLATAQTEVVKYKRMYFRQLAKKRFAK